MSKKYSNTTADCLEWDNAMNLIRNLYNDEKYSMSLLIALGCFFGLRISDILALKWETILDKNEFELIEKKTNKKRIIKINSQLKKYIVDCHQKVNPQSIEQYIFISQKGTLFSIQRINVLLKSMKVDYNLKIKNFSTHSLRKCFGREIFYRSGEKAEMAIVKLSYLFNHSNSSVTRRYLGISSQELLETYDILSF